jgi:hypothetical protein
MLQNWMVVCRRGWALFLEQTRAEEYAAMHNGVVHHMVPSTEYSRVKEAPDISVDIRQERAAPLTRNQQLSKDTPTDGKVCSGSGAASKAVSACRDSGPCKAEGLDKGPQNGGHTLQCSWCPGQCETMCLLHPHDSTNQHSTD